MRDLGSVNEISKPIHLSVFLGSRLEERPHRNHQMKVLLMELIEHGVRIGIILVKHVLTFAVPPEPVLHNVVHRDVQVAILLRHGKNFFLRLVTVFALPKPICPPPKHWRRAGQFAVAGDDFVEFRAVDEIVVNCVGHFGADIHHVNKAIVDASARGIVPENAISVRGKQHWNSNFRVLL